MLPHGAHRIFTVNLDLLHQLPLPSRHPQTNDKLLPGMEKEWRIYLKPIANTLAIFLQKLVF